MRGHPLQDAEKYRLLLELSAKLIGHIREAGTHSGGMVFGTAERHLSELVPLEPSGTEGLLRCQYDKDDLERVGIPKLDLLGLRMHTALHAAGMLVSKRLGRKVDPYDLPPDNKKTYALIRTGNNVGMFQLESPGQMQLSRRLRPRGSRTRGPDLAVQAGPGQGRPRHPYVMRKNCRERYRAILPELEEILKPTYGVLVFQEQVLAVANAVAGFTLAEGDFLRRAMTKDRGPGAMQELRREFLHRARGNGVPAAEADKVFSWMEGFSVYGFSAAHGASFAELSYASAYMRCHYPAEFFAGVLNSQPMGFYSPRLLLNEARRVGVGILPLPYTSRVMALPSRKMARLCAWAYATARVSRRGLSRPSSPSVARRRSAPSRTSTKGRPSRRTRWRASSGAGSSTLWRRGPNGRGCSTKP
jgi:DNA polymerase III alpha subunit